MMKESEGSKSFKSLVEVNISFVPYESQVGISFVFFLFSISGGVLFTNNFNRRPAIFSADTKIVLCVCALPRAATSKGVLGKWMNLVNTDSMLLLHGAETSFSNKDSYF